MRPGHTAPSRQAPLLRLPDGTVKQVNPFTGTQVWTVPGRGNRPLEHPPEQVEDVQPGVPEAHCAFCTTRMTETTPEKQRSVPVAGGGWRTVTEVPVARLADSPWDVRVVGNLFEIVSTDYWLQVHGQPISPRARAHRESYLGQEAGREHVRTLLNTRLRASGSSGDEAERLASGWGAEELAEHAAGFFGGGHDVVIARRHLVDGAERSDRHAASGTLGRAEHAEFCAVAARTAARLYEDMPHAAHVTVFQNWLRPAGASFDHLHKQVVAIDEVPAQMDHERRALRSDPRLYDRMGLGSAWDEGLVVARNSHAVAVVGVGHRYPSLVVWSTAPACEPWLHDEAAFRGFCDALHACHAATGPLVPCNEEWHHRRRGGEPAPWRVVLKWRVSTPAGFEGATGVYITTIDPWSLRARVVPRLTELRAAGVVAPDLLIGDECGVRPPEMRFREAAAGR